MAETYTPNLGLTVIGTNDLAGSWGTATNNNLQYGLEQAITGYYSVTYASADQQVTLPGSSGPTSGTTSSQARSLYYVLGGTNSAQQNFFVPAGNTKLYIIKNATSGGFGIQVLPGTIGSPTGSGVVIPNGSTYIVYNDGTNINQVSVYPVAGLTPNSNGAYTIPNPASGTALTVDGAVGTNTVSIIGSATGGSYGLGIQAGTGSGDSALKVVNQANTLQYFNVAGDGGVIIGNAATTDEGAGTLNIQNGIYVAGLQQSKYVACFRTQAQQTNGNGVLTPDAYLVSPSLPAGTYKVRLFLQFWENASATSPGFKFEMAVGGTISGQSWLSANGTVNNATYTSLFGSFTSTVQFHPIQSTNTTGSDFLVCEGIVTTTTAGTISLTWASYVSGNASFPATLSTNSYMEIEQSN